MKKHIGRLLLIAMHLINAVTVLGAMVYVVGMTLWMHAPVMQVLQLTALVVVWPLALAWFCGRISQRLRQQSPVMPSSPAARALLAVAGLVMIGSAVPTAAKVFKQYQCSIDPSYSAAAREKQILSDGFERVCDGDLDRFDIAFGSLERATRKLAFKPVDLTRTPFSTFEALGGLSESVVNVPSRLYRGFRMPDGHRITLLEQDMSADGTRLWRDPRDEPERINGLPARLTVKEDSSGTSVSHLSWTEGRRSYELWIDANVVTMPMREQLFALAASLPRSVPACPNEKPPKPGRRGPDGFAADEPMPASLSQGEMDAMPNQGLAGNRRSDVQASTHLVSARP